MKPWLLLPPKWAHELSPLVLPVYASFFDSKTPTWKSFSWRGLTFKNRLGIAGGVDKNAENLNSWWQLGCGFVEVGTITPQPQEPNPGKIFDRDITHQSMWNKMGFPNAGADEILANIRSYSPYIRTPIFVNIGKNRTTANEDAHQDYTELLEKFHSVADVFVVNISSPNTKGLRDLQNKNSLQDLLSQIISKNKSLAATNIATPILIKLSPDMPADILTETVSLCADMGIDGFILTNTTLTRHNGCPYPNEGGLSGKPLAALSEAALKTTIETLGSRRQNMLIVSAGGVMSADDVQKRLGLGADLVQVYSALVFQGPGFFHQVAREYRDERKYD